MEILYEKRKEALNTRTDLEEKIHQI